VIVFKVDRTEARRRRGTARACRLRRRRMARVAGCRCALPMVVRVVDTAFDRKGGRRLFGAVVDGTAPSRGGLAVVPSDRRRWCSAGPRLRRRRQRREFHDGRRCRPSSCACRCCASLRFCVAETADAGQVCFSEIGELEGQLSDRTSEWSRHEDTRETSSGRNVDISNHEMR